LRIGGSSEDGWRERPQFRSTQSLHPGCGKTRRESKTLLNAVRGAECERRDLDIELLAAGRSHLKRAVHASGGRFQRAPRRVLERCARPEHRLLAHDSGTLHFAETAETIGDDPMAAEELNGIAAEIRDANSVFEYPFAGAGIFGGMPRENLDTNLVRDCIRNRSEFGRLRGHLKGYRSRGTAVVSCAITDVTVPWRAFE